MMLVESASWERNRLVGLAIASRVAFAADGEAFNLALDTLSGKRTRPDVDADLDSLKGDDVYDVPMAGREATLRVKVEDGGR